MKRRLSIPSLLLGLVALVAACDAAPGMTRKGAQAPGAAHPDAVGQTTTTSGPSAEPLPRNAPAASGAPPVQTVGLSVSEAIISACSINPRKDGGTYAPNFEFDSAALADEDRQLLGEVAKCLTEGSLKGRAVALVGRADPRGEAEYNMGLGESRSDSVKRYLVDLGVSRDKVKATSRGELDATGKDEQGWAHDRRVDIDLVP